MLNFWFRRRVLLFNLFDLVFWPAGMALMFYQDTAIGADQRHWLVMYALPFVLGLSVGDISTKGERALRWQQEHPNG